MNQAGFVDFFTVDLVAGWAWDPAQPDEPIDVAIIDGEATIATVRADHYRRDLEEAGVGNGRHGFFVRDLGRHVLWPRRTVSIRRASDGGELAGSPGSLVPLAGPCLLVARETGGWFVGLGRDAYRLNSTALATELAALLPLGIVEEGDDKPRLIGEATLAREVPATLRLQPFGSESPVLLRLDTIPIGVSTVRACRDGPTKDNWVGHQFTLEVENVSAVELVCSLPGAPGLAPKSLTVELDSAPPRSFALERGPDSTIAFRTGRSDRNRVRFITEPPSEPSAQPGFLLRRLNILPDAESWTPG